MFPKYLRHDELLDASEKILGADTIDTGRTVVRYASQWDLKTRKDVGPPEPVADEGDQE